jgi:AraC-like DNA-binding protein
MKTLGYSLDPTWRTLLKELGVAPADVLRRAELPEDSFERLSVRLTPAEYYRLWDAVEAAFGDPLFPLRLCQAVTTDSFTPLVFAALCCPHLLAAAERVSRYKALLAPERVDITEHGGLVTFDLRWTDAPPSPPVSLVMKELLVAVRLARLGTREHVCPVEVTTDTLPSPLEPYETFLGAALRQGPRHQITFTVADATRPFLTSDEGMWAAFEPGLRQRLAELEAHSTTTVRVRAALLEALPSGHGTLEEVGRRLALSKRTLQRRIEAEGTSFQRILSEIRETVARHYLEATALPVAQIALLVGYDEPNSFARAFKTWTGSTPDTVRRRRETLSAAAGER